MKYLSRLFENNRAWAETLARQDPEFFPRLASLQAPDYLWIGCSDSRVPANQITGLLPGELFVHRNVANIVASDDINAMAVVQYAVAVLKVKHLIVCGHYNCGGVQAVLSGESPDLVRRWLWHVVDVRVRHAAVLDRLKDPAERWKRLCELNVVEQVRHLCGVVPVVDAWKRGQDLTVHGWIYDPHNGLLRDLEITVRIPTELETAYRRALERLTQSERQGS